MWLMVSLVQFEYRIQKCKSLLYYGQHENETQFQDSGGKKKNVLLTQVLLTPDLIHKCRHI